MCRNITELRGLEPPATREEIEAAARQYIRKVSGIAKPSPAFADRMEDAFEFAGRALTLVRERGQRPYEAWPSASSARSRRTCVTATTRAPR